MANRESVSTIRGYFYQFDYSIIQVLSLKNDDDTICVEGVEDVDINKENNIAFHQCKCYEGSEYNHSVIAPAVRWMLKHFSENKASKYNYYIYGVFRSGQNKLTTITVDFAKKHFFTYTKDKKKHILYSELSLSDADISSFLSKLKINIRAESYEKQEETVKQLLCSCLGCRKQNVEPYYCSALSAIKDLATKDNISDRTISRAEFISKLQNVDAQYEMWLLQKNGTSKFAKAVKKKYFYNGLNISPYNRFFLIECDNSTSLTDLKTVLIHISDIYSNLSSRAKPKFCPYFCLYGLNEENLIDLKKKLARDKVVFTDGYNFRGADFSASTVVKEPTKDNLIQLRIIDSIDFLESVYMATCSTIEIYQFYCSKIYYENTSHKHIKIPFEKVIDIIEMV